MRQQYIKNKQYSIKIHIYHIHFAVNTIKIGNLHNRISDKQEQHKK